MREHVRNARHPADDPADPLLASEHALTDHDEQILRDATDIEPLVREGGLDPAWEMDAFRDGFRNSGEWSPAPEDDRPGPEERPGRPH